MTEQVGSKVAIVDYGMGNLYSVSRACTYMGMSPVLASTPEALQEVDGIILPGVGAFADAIRSLRDCGMADALKDAVGEGRPLLGICLGLQLLMTESEEFGKYRGLDLIPGTVERLQGQSTNGDRLKVPQVGWNRLYEPAEGAWKGTLLDGVDSSDTVYFVHSYCVRPEDDAHVLSTSTYGVDRFCSTIQAGSVVGCQYHPELSGPTGLAIYRNFLIDVRASAVA